MKSCGPREKGALQVESAMRVTDGRNPRRSESILYEDCFGR